MKNRGRFLVHRLFVVILVILTSGCQNARELGVLSIVSGIGIDSCDQGVESLSLTAQILLPSQIKSGSRGGESGSTSGGEGAKPYYNLKKNGDTVLDALRTMTQLIDYKLYLAHNNVIIFGREIARSGIRTHLDFFVKEVETRLITQIYIADGDASDVLDAGDVFQTAPAINLRILGESQIFNSFSTAVTLQDFSSKLLSKTASAVVPLVKIEEINGRKLQRIAGLAVFKSDRMIGELDEKESRGLLFVLDKVKYGLTQVTYKDQDVTLELISSSTKLKPQLEGQDITFNIKVKISSHMMEQSGSEPLATGKDLDNLEEKQREAIVQEINLALKKAKSLSADFFGFGELLKKYYPSEWEMMEDSWDELFQKVKINVTIKNQIRDTGIAGMPLAPEKEEQ